MSFDAGDRWVEYEIKEREQVGRYMYDHQEDYVSRSRYEKIVDQLTKAKEHIKILKEKDNEYARLLNDYNDLVDDYNKLQKAYCEATGERYYEESSD